MTRTNILPPDAPIVDRLRAHAARMVEDHATCLNGHGYATEKWEREDLERVLDEAADTIESKEASSE
jgi:hypothetical protein